MEPTLYTPLPDDWTLGLADVVGSTKAIAENRYKAVNMAGAAVIAGVKNALGGADFPYVFGGDGASFAVSPPHLAPAREALAAVARGCCGEGTRCSRTRSDIGTSRGGVDPPLGRKQFR